MQRKWPNPFLKQIITGNEKWVIYNNAVRKRSWRKQSEKPLTTPKPGLRQEKIMCIWWDWKGVVVYYELLPKNVRLNSDKYWAQLEKLKEVISKKHSELVNRCFIPSRQCQASCFFDYSRNNIATRLGSFATFAIFARLLLLITTYFESCKTSLIIRHSLLWKIAEITFNSFSIKKRTSSTRKELCSWLKDVKKLQKTTAITL